MNKGKVNKFFLIVFYVGISILFILPYIKWHQLNYGWDMVFHLRRINELAFTMKKGELLSYISTYDFKNFGFPIGIFYPNLTLLPFAIFKNLLGSWYISILAGVATYTFIALLLTHWVVYKLSRNEYQAIIAAILYAFGTYRIVDIWTRFALGEFIALTFLPLVVYGIYSIVFGNYKDWPFLSCGLALTMLSHVLSAYINIWFCILILMIGIMFMIHHKLFNRIMSLVKAGALFLGLSAVFIFPFIEQELTHIYSQPAPLKLSFFASLPSDVLWSMINNNYFGYYNWHKSEVFTVGIVGLVVIVIFPFLYHYFSKKEKVSYFLTLFLIVLPTTLIPWSIFDHNVLIDVIQFPFRELGIATFLVAILGSKELCIIFLKITGNFERTMLVFAIVCLVFLPWYSSLSTLRSANSIVTDSVIKDNMKSNRYGTLNLDNYTPTAGQSDLTNVSERHLGMLNGRSHVFNNYMAEPNALMYKLNIKKKDKIVLPFYTMKNLEVTIDGKKQSIFHTKQMLLKFTSNTNGNSIKVEFVPSIFDKLGAILSLISWLSLVGYALLTYRITLKRE